jgi:hypothetical protein
MVYPTVDGSILVCFESHLVAGLGLPPSKFLIAIMNFHGCELVHLNLNAIATLPHGMIKLFTPGSDYRCVTTIERSTSMPPSRASGGVLSKCGFWLICTFPLNG